MIGRRGQTLDSLQELTRTAVQRQAPLPHPAAGRRRGLPGPPPLLPGRLRPLDRRAGQGAGDRDRARADVRLRAEDRPRRRVARSTERRASARARSRTARLSSAGSKTPGGRAFHDSRGPWLTPPWTRYEELLRAWAPKLNLVSAADLPTAPGTPYRGFAPSRAPARRAPARSLCRRRLGGGPARDPSGDRRPPAPVAPAGAPPPPGGVPGGGGSGARPRRGGAAAHGGAGRRGPGRGARPGRRPSPGRAGRGPRPVDPLGGDRGCGGGLSGTRGRGSPRSRGVGRGHCYSPKKGLTAKGLSWRNWQHPRIGKYWRPGP